MPLWNIVLSGYPASGKTVLARRLVSENPNFVRLNVDDLRDMYFGSAEPRDEEVVYNSLATLRDSFLTGERSVIIDSTAPNETTRDYLLNTKVRGAVKLLVLMVVDRKVLEARIQLRRLKGTIEAWDKTWETPSSHMPLMKFRNNSPEEFETSYYVLTDLLNSKVHPYKRRFLEHIYPRT